MKPKSVRLEVRVTPELYAALQKESEQSSKSMGEIVREAVGEYVTKRSSTNKQELLQQLVRLGAPVADWEAMKQEIRDAMASADDESSLHRMPDSEEDGSN